MIAKTSSAAELHYKPAVCRVRGNWLGNENYLNRPIACSVVCLFRSLSLEASLSEFHTIYKRDVTALRLVYEHTPVTLLLYLLIHLHAYPSSAVPQPCRSPGSPSPCLLPGIEGRYDEGTTKQSSGTRQWYSASLLSHFSLYMFPSMASMTKGPSG